METAFAICRYKNLNVWHGDHSEGQCGARNANRGRERVVFQKRHACLFRASRLAGDQAGSLGVSCSQNAKEPRRFTAIRFQEKSRWSEPGALRATCLMRTGLNGDILGT